MRFFKPQTQTPSFPSIDFIVRTALSELGEEITNLTGRK